MQPPKRILCVDDHADTCEMLAQLLKLAGYESDSAATAQAALTLARADGFALYVIDNRLPDGDGIELCHYLRALHPLKPIVFYSADAYPVHHQEAIEAGANAYIDKPHIHELIAAVKDFLK